MSTRQAHSTAASPKVARKAAPAHMSGLAAFPDTSHGDPLEESALQSLAPRFGFDLGHIRIHADAAAADSAEARGARAYTYGSHVVLGRGEYQPRTARGRALLAHELAHVSQQLSGDTATEEAQEREAKRAESGATIPFTPTGAPFPTLRFARGDIIALTIFTDENGGAAFRAELEGGGELTGSGSVQELDPGGYRITLVDGLFVIRYLDGQGAPASTRFDIPGSKRNDPINRALNASEGVELPMRVIGGQAVTTRKGTSRALTDVEAAKDALESLPERVRAILFSDAGEAVKTTDYATMLRIGRKLSALSDAELEEYAARTTSTTSNPAELEAAVDAFTTQLERRRDAERELDDAGMALFGQESVYAMWKRWNGTGGSFLFELDQVTEWEAMPTADVPTWSEYSGLNIYLDLRHALARHGHANVAAFTAAVERYIKAFAEQAAHVAFEGLDRYEHLLLAERARYGDTATTGPLHQRLEPARTTFQEAEQYRSEQLEQYSGPDAEMYAFLWKDPAHERLIAQGHEQVAALAPTDPLLANPNFPRETLALQGSGEGVRSVIQRYITDSLEGVRESRQQIAEDADSIFDNHLDVLIEQTKAAVGAKPGTIWAEIVDDYQQLLRDREFFGEMALLALTIALTVVTFGAAAPVALAAGAASFGLSAYQAYQQYQEYAIQKDAYMAQLLSTEPWAGWVVIAIIGAGVDLAGVAKAIKPAAAALREFQATAESTEALAKLRTGLDAAGVEKKVADSIMSAAQSEAQARKTWKAVLPEGTAKGAALQPGAQLAGPAAYSVQLSLRRGVRGFTAWARTPEAVDLIGDVSKLSPAELRRAKTVYQFAVADVDRVTKHGRAVGLAPDEIDDFIESWARKGGSPDDDMKAMAHGNWGRYQKMSDLEVFTKYADDGDPTAAAEIRRRFPSNDAALRKILESEYRPPHSATTVLRRNGREAGRTSLTSGNMTPEERALGFPRSMLATHTEARAVRRVPLQEGDVLEIRGQYDPCGSCQRAMQEAATNTGATIRYWWPGGGTVEFTP